MNWIPSSSMEVESSVERGGGLNIRVDYFAWLPKVGPPERQSILAAVFNVISVIATWRVLGDVPVTRGCRVCTLMPCHCYDDDSRLLSEKWNQFVNDHPQNKRCTYYVAAYDFPPITWLEKWSVFVNWLQQLHVIVYASPTNCGTCTCNMSQAGMSVFHHSPPA